MSKQSRIIVYKEGNLFVAECLEVEIASQGSTSEEAIKNLKEAIELCLEDLDSSMSEIVAEVKIVRAIRKTKLKNS